MKCIASWFEVLHIRGKRALTKYAAAARAQAIHHHSQTKENQIICTGHNGEH